MTDFKPILEKWVEKLDLYDFHIYISFEPENPNNLKASCIQWNDKLDAFVIHILDPFDERVIIHELGHLYFAKLYDDISILKAPKPIGYNINQDKCIRLINDAFTNYHLSKFKEYYMLLFKNVKKGIRFKHKKGLKFMDYMSKYLLGYLQLNFVLTPEERSNNYQFILAWLKDLRSNIIKSNPTVTHKWFQELDNILNGFRRIRDIKNSKVYFAFRDKILDFILK